VIALIAAAMRDFMPRTDTLPGIVDTDVSGFLRKLRRESNFLYWLGLCIGAWVYTLTPLFTVYVPLPAFLLSERLRDLHAQRIAQSNVYLLRQAVFLVRLSAGMCWGSDPRVRGHFALQPYPKDPGTFRTQ
jgi:hypothetical protein